MSRVYLDHASTSPLTVAALDAMRPHLLEGNANASSLHLEGQRARAAIEEARALVASSLGVTDDEIIFTSSGTEASNLAVRGACWASDVPRPRVVTTAIEHASVWRTARWLDACGHAESHVVAPTEEGVVDADEVLSHVREHTAVVSVMLVNNEVGTVQPVAEIGRMLRDRGVLFHVDAVQALGKLPVRPEEIPADMVTLSAHKVGGPQACGVLVVRRGVKLQPVITGGEQEMGLRAGTESVATIAGAARAIADAVADRATCAARLEVLTEHLRRGLAALPGASLNGPERGRAPGIVNVSFDGADAEIVMQSLDLAGFAVSTGSACTAGSTAPSHVLSAMGQSAARARSAVRFSLATSNSAGDIDRLLAVLPAVLSTCRAQVHG